jgi:molecular chaperone DnaJ
MDKDPYEILGISRNATAEEIKHAFKSLAKKYHPDLNPGDKRAEEKFKELNEAYRIITNKSTSTDNGTNEGFGGFEDIFDFGFGDIFRNFGFGSDFDSKGEDLRYDLNITVDDVFREGYKTIALRRAVTCKNCGGTGAKERHTCSKCRGSGKIRRSSRQFGSMFITVSDCDNCGGSGYIVDKRCDSCNGKGTIYDNDTIQITIRKNVYEGYYTIIKGHGGQGKRGNGDLYVVFHIVGNNTFKIHGTDLISNLHVDIRDIINDKTIEIKTPEGNLKITLNKGEKGPIIIKGSGLFGKNGKRGDIVLNLIMIVPSDVSPEKLKELDKLLGKRIEPFISMEN